MSFLPFGGDRAAALHALNQAQEREGVLRLARDLPTAPLHDLVNAVKELLRDDRFMGSLMNLAFNNKLADVERMGQNLGNLVQSNGIPDVIPQAPFSGKVAQMLIGMNALRVGLEKATDQRGLFFVNNDGSQPGMIQIPDRRPAGKLASGKFLAEASADVFGKVVHVVFRLSKGNVQHELALGCVLKPEIGELERIKFAEVQQVDDSATVNGVPGQPVGVP